MIEIKEVKTKSDKRKFVDFPTKLYKGCDQYVHPLRMDELNLFSHKNVSYEDCDTIGFLAYKDGKLAGRIAGIEQRIYNEKVHEKRIRFTRFDCINDVEVAKALFNAVEEWAKSKGMDIVHGPLGFNDLDREGMLIEGFDELATFEEQYNYPYYPELMEKCGYGKEVDWLEYKIFPTYGEREKRVEELAEKVLKRYNLRMVKEKSKKKFIEKYKKGVFEVIDEAYGDLHGVVPYTDKLRDQIINQFKMFISLKYMVTIVNEKDEVVAFGFAIPSLSRAVQKCKGRLTPCGIARLLYAVNHPKILDFALIGIRKSYLNKGLPAIVLNYIMKHLDEFGVEYCETNLNLEYNIPIQNQWKNFDHVQHKRRRCYIKYLNESAKKD